MVYLNHVKTLDVLLQAEKETFGSSVQMERKSIQRAGEVPVCSVILQGDWPQQELLAAMLTKSLGIWLQQGMERFEMDKNLTKKWGVYVLATSKSILVS